MDQIAIISDIHGNSTALKTVLKDIKERQITNIICLGDTVLKNVDPKQCLQLVRENCQVVLKGNTDEVVAELNENKEEHIWNYEKLSKEEIEFLKNLPISYEFYCSGHLIRCFHSSPIKLNHIINLAHIENRTISADEMFLNTSFIGKTENDPIPDIVIYGHTHTNGLGRFGNKQLVNVGSVGCPAEILNHDDTDPKNALTTVANYCIVEGVLDSKDLSSISFTFLRLRYDIKEEEKRLKNSDMPNKDLAIKELNYGIYKKR